jgi:hypothetical protein
MQMLILSDRLLLSEEQRKNLQNIELFPWKRSFERRLTDCEVVVLDAFLSPTSAEMGNLPFFSKQDEVYGLMSSGGVVICLTWMPANTKGVYKVWNEMRRRYDDVIETNYQWLEKWDRRSLAIEEQRPPGKNFQITTKNRLFLDYLGKVTEYHRTLGKITYNEDQKKFYYTRIYPNAKYDCEVIAVNKVTGEPIACSIDYKNGTLMFLPQSNASADSVVRCLYDIGKKYYSRNRESIGVPIVTPTWFGKYKTKQEKELECQVREAEENLSELRRSHRRFEEIDALLYGYGRALEDAVQRVFKAEWKCDVEKTPPGATVDFKVVTPTAKKKFIVEVTGIVDKVCKDDYKISQALQYLTQDWVLGEKITILVNTYRETEVDKRNPENFTPPVIEIATNNKFCLITTWDLYRLWRDSLNGRNVDEILEDVYNTIGEYRYSFPKRSKAV